MIMTLLKIRLTNWLCDNLIQQVNLHESNLRTYEKLCHQFLRKYREILKLFGSIMFPKIAKPKRSILD